MPLIATSWSMCDGSKSRMWAVTPKLKTRTWEGWDRGHNGVRKGSKSRMWAVTPKLKTRTWEGWDRGFKVVRDGSGGGFDRGLDRGPTTLPGWRVALPSLDKGLDRG